VIELYRAGKFAEAMPLAERYADAMKAQHGPEHPEYATALGNLAILLEEGWGSYAESESLKRRELAIDEKGFGPEHPKVAIRLNNLAHLLQNTNRQAEAEPLMRRALAIDVKSLGPEHPTVDNLAFLRAKLGDWAEATRLHRRAKSIMTAGGHRQQDADRDLTRVTLAAHTWGLRALARAIYRTDSDSPAAREEAFEIAQWALQTGAADALSQMSSRFAKGAGPLAALVRERQDLVGRRLAETRRLDVGCRTCRHNGSPGGPRSHWCARLQSRCY
jgi:tetratricopeptide (TPR) repeat protein